MFIFFNVFENEYYQSVIIDNVTFIHSFKNSLSLGFENVNPPKKKQNYVSTKLSLNFINFNKYYAKSVNITVFKR